MKERSEKPGVAGHRSDRMPLSEIDRVPLLGIANATKRAPAPATGGLARGSHAWTKIESLSSRTDYELQRKTAERVEKEAETDSNGKGI